MRAIYIDVAAMEVFEIELPDDEPQLFEAIRQYMGCKVLALGAVFPNQDVLYVNHLGVLESELYFKHSLAPVPIPDNAIVLGSVPRTGEPCSARSTVAVTRVSVRFMDKWDALEWAIAAQEAITAERAHAA